MKTLLVIAISLIFFPFQTIAQEWRTQGSGASLTVETFAVMGDTLFIGGIFSSIGGKSAKCLAAYDSGFISFNTGTLAGGPVKCLEEFNGKMFSGGEHYFSPFGPYNVLENNGNSWDGPYSFYGSVNDLIVFNNELFACGDGSQTIGPGPSVSKIGKWNAISSAWVNVDTSGAKDAVYDMEIFNAELYAAGAFDTINGMAANKIAKWDGSSWTAIGSGITGVIYTMTVYDNKLFIGGSFNISGIASEHIAYWDGSSWNAVGAGFSQFGRVYCFAIYNNKLIIGGFFEEGDGNPGNYIAQWDGSSYSSLGEGITGEPVFLSRSVYAMEAYKGELWVGGDFSGVGADTMQADNIAIWSVSNPNPGIKEIGEVSAAIFPNPFSDVVYLKTVLQEVAKLRIYDMGGRLIQTSDLAVGSNTCTWRAPHQGIFLYEIKNGDGISHGKLIAH